MIKYFKSQKGSAYLIVLGAMIIAMFALLYSLQSSMDTKQKQARLQDRLIANNLSSICIELAYHNLKLSQIDKKEIEKSKSLNLGGAKCLYEINKAQGLVYTVTAIGEIQGIKQEKVAIMRADLKYEYHKNKLIWQKELVNNKDL